MSSIVSFITTVEEYERVSGRELGDRFRADTLVLVDLDDSAVVAWQAVHGEPILAELARATGRRLLADGEVVYVATETGQGSGFGRLVRWNPRPLVVFHDERGGQVRCSFSPERIRPVRVVDLLAA